MKRVVHGEPYIRERTIAPHWLTESAERESARRFVMRVAKPATRQTVCDDGHVFLARSRRLSGLNRWYGVPFQNATFRHGALSKRAKTLGLSV